MHATVLAVLLFQSIFVSLVQATLYVIEPTAGSTCSGGKPCTVAWLDDGTAPLLAEIGATHVALYNGEHVLVQQIDPVDISVVHAFTFTPDPNAGSNSGN
ncbi:hypothetical protein C8Q70DRAFT_919389 [Cubamyces menziesii]|nr:hypothetical protein C8Q70DRAFT_919389 [Cubamyces menziesii]